MTMLAADDLVQGSPVHAIRICVLPVSYTTTPFFDRSVMRNERFSSLHYR